jgi:hypothetical protein
LLSLTYVSSASTLFDTAQLVEMLADWRAKNTELGLTGMLLYRGGNVMQALEGLDETVDAMFDTISRDSRHRDVITLLREPISERAFPDWSMGFRDLSLEEAGETDGFNPFLQRQAAPAPGTSESSAHRLLTLFKKSVR